MLSNDIEILKIANKWKSSGKKVVLATVIQTWGSAPRGVGSKLVIDQDGNFEGSVSGGCVEGAVISEALDLIEAVQIPDPKNKINSYPFQLSGGQRQRVMIAMALA